MSKENNEASNNRPKRGFAAMSPEEQRRIASMGGRAAHATGHAHEFTSEEAKAAGRKRHEKKNASSGTAGSHPGATTR